MLRNGLTSPLRPSPPGEGKHENAYLGKGMNASPGGEATVAVQPKSESTSSQPKKSSVIHFRFPVLPVRAYSVTSA